MKNLKEDSTSQTSPSNFVKEKGQKKKKKKKKIYQALKSN